MEDYTEEEKKCYNKLIRAFRSVLVYNGDDELISSCNDEYRLDPNDFFLTDGLVNSSMELIKIRNDETSEYTQKAIHNTIAVRGASYLIIGSVKDGSYELDLKVEKPLMVEKFDEIMKAKGKIKKHFQDMDYYCTSWRCKAVENDTPIFDLY